MPGKDYEGEFRQFHHDNPRVYAELVRLARHARIRGHKRIGIRMLWEVTRWNLTVETRDTNSDFKLNDHYHSRYARLIMAQEADLEGVFELRELKTANDGPAPVVGESAFDPNDPFLDS